MQHIKRINLLWIIFCLLMCSCAHPTDENINGGVITNNTNATYVGVWQASTSKYGDIFPTSIELLSNGRALFLNVDSYQIDEAP